MIALFARQLQRSWLEVTNILLLGKATHGRYNKDATRIFIAKISGTPWTLMRFIQECSIVVAMMICVMKYIFGMNKFALEFFNILYANMHVYIFNRSITMQQFLFTAYIFVTAFCESKLTNRSFCWTPNSLFRYQHWQVASSIVKPVYSSEIFDTKPILLLKSEIILFTYLVRIYLQYKVQGSLPTAMLLRLATYLHFMHYYRLIYIHFINNTS